MKFVGILRNIFDHAISAYSHRAGVHDLPPFSEWIQDDPKRETSDKFRSGVDGYEFWGEARKFLRALEDRRFSFTTLNHAEDLVSSFSDLLEVEIETPKENEANVSLNSVEAQILTEFK